MNSKFLVYVLKRLGMAILTIFLVIAITFFVMHAIPASPFSSEKAKSDAVIAALEAKYGFDKPVGIQFLNYLWSVLHFDFGLSTGWVGNTVFDLIKGGFSYSARIGFAAALLAIVLGVVLGSVAALNRGKLIDRIVQVTTTALVSLPSFVMATLLLLVFALRLSWLPSMGNQPGGLVLPIISLSLYPMAYVTRLQRSSMLDVLGQDYIRTARAKGVKTRTLVLKHALRNSLIPVITYLGPVTAGIITGSFVVESTFQIPGLGKYFVQSVMNRDYPIIMATTVILSALVIAMNLVVDLAYRLVDPRITLTVKEG